MTIFNETFKPFLNELSAWISDGCQEHKIFRNNVGICSNYADWLYDRDYEREIVRDIVWITNLPELFSSEGLSSDYPFNEDEWAGYMAERRDKTTYKNPDRLAWIESHK